MFNVFNRNQGTHWSVADFAIYLAMMAYLLTPWLVWQCLRTGSPAADAGRATSRMASLRVLVLWAAPFLLFALVATRRSVGLHWVLGFVPLFVLWAGLRLSPESLRRSLRWTGWLAVPHALLLFALFAAPLAWWQRSDQFAAVVFLREAPAVSVALQKDLPPEATLMARGYSPAAVLAFHTGRYVPVFGVGRFHARQDDQWVDFRALEGKPVRIYDRRPLREGEFSAYFESVKPGTFEVAGLRLHYLDGQGFKFNPYRDQILRQAADSFHRVPHWLPVLGSPFCERYAFRDCSPSGR
jgi:hypothetical protein